MKIIRFKKKGRVYEFLDETTLDNSKNSIQVIGGGVRVEITEENKELIIQLPDVRTRFKVDPDKREFILSKKRKVREET